MYVIRVYSFGTDVGYVARCSGRFILAVTRKNDQVERFPHVVHALKRILDLPEGSFKYSILDDSEVYLDV